MEGYLIFTLLVCLASTGYGLAHDEFTKRGQDIPIEKCPVVCPRKNATICAADGNTYINECIMKANAPGSTTVHDGQCEPKCRIACPKENDPQCGSNGKTYSNPCILRATVCESDGEITFAYRGECKGRPKLPKVCPLEIFPVCASDRNSYINKCFMSGTGCQMGLNMWKKSGGNCDPKCNYVCTKEYDPQCGTDGKTYSDQCEMRAAICESDGEVVLAHSGECDPCKLPSDPGPCKGYFPKYYYNSESGKCEIFIYGGCGGNVNRFDALEECEEECG